MEIISTAVVALASIAGGTLLFQFISRRQATRCTGTESVQIIIWARSGKVPGLHKPKKWTKAVVTVDEEQRLTWVKPQGEPIALILRSRESRPRTAKDLFFLDPGTPVWDAVTADGQELGIVIPRASEQGFAAKLAVATPAA
ncbi:hypothetical protein GCM10027059_42330 [Myceligenerans halotolerans]